MDRSEEGTGMGTTTTSAVRIEPGPREVSDFGADYADAFRVAARVPAAARSWAERSLRGADAAGGVFRRCVWGGVLGLRIRPGDEPGTLVGWAIAHDEPDRFVLEALGGALMDGRMAFVLDDGTLTWTTLLRYRGRRARPTWTALGPVHRALAPRSLRGAARSLERSVPPPA